MTLQKIWTVEEEYFFIRKIFCDFGSSIFDQTEKLARGCPIQKRKKYGYFNFLSNFFNDKKPTQVKSKLQKIVGRMKNINYNKKPTELNYLKKYFKKKLPEIQRLYDKKDFRDNLQIVYDEDFDYINKASKVQIKGEKKKLSICSEVTDYDNTLESKSDKSNEIITKNIVHTEIINEYIDDINIQIDMKLMKSQDFNTALGKLINRFEEFKCSFEIVKQVTGKDPELVAKEKKIDFYIGKINSVINKFLNDVSDDMLLESNLFLNTKCHFN